MNIIKNPKIIIPLVVAVLVLGVGIWYFVLRDNPNTTANSTENQPVDEGPINLNPPTEDEQQAGDKQKENLQTDKEETPTDTSGLKKVMPVISSSGTFQAKFEVSARVPGIVEDNGICTLSLTKDDNTVTGTKKASANVSETSCGFIGVDRSKVTTGTWSAVVTYESTTAKGSSKPTEVEVE